MQNKDFKVRRIRITPAVIKKFYFEDKRQELRAYWIDVAYVKEQLKEYCDDGQKQKRYDLTVFNYNHEDPLYHITDGGHRTNALRQLFEEKAIDYLDAILLPGTTAHGYDNQVQRSNDLIALLKKERLPEEIIKQRHKKVDGKYITIIRPY